MKSAELVDHRIREGDAARAAVFCFFKTGEAIVEVDVAPFEFEDFTLTGASAEGEEDDAVEVGATAFATSNEELFDLLF